MAKKSRYKSYYEAVLGQKQKTVRSTKASVLDRLKELKNQELVMHVPIGEGNE